MSEQKKPPNKPSTSTQQLCDAEQPIVTYLRDHPEFFNRHLNLLETLSIPHPCGPAVSLLERQLLYMREWNAQLQKKLTELVAVAQENGYLVSRMQRLALVLIKHQELETMLEEIKTVLQDEFNADFVILKVTAQAAGSTTETCLSANQQVLFEPVLRSGKPQCGQLNYEQITSLFGDVSASIASVALVPLWGTGWCGLLGVGSQDKQRFHPGMGMLFLKSMGELISQALETKIYSKSEPNHDLASPIVSTENE